jgi:hypothetical protein
MKWKITAKVEKIYTFPSIQEARDEFKYDMGFARMDFDIENIERVG